MRIRRLIHGVPLILTLAAGCGRDTAHNALAPSPPNGVTSTDFSTTAIITLPFEASNFTNGVPNEFFPLVPRTTWTYRQETAEGVEINAVEVLQQRKAILGVSTFVIHDQVYRNGALKEDTFDWYAPDEDGNVWYFGEDTRSFEADGSVSTAGSWEAGTNGAVPGIIMLAHPRMGDVYQQENSPGIVEDMARVKGLDETVAVPYGTFTGCLKTQEWTPLESGNRAFKFYAPGIGNIREEPNKTDGPLLLTDFSRP